MGKSKTVCILSCLLGMDDSANLFFARAISDAGYPLRLICTGNLPDSLQGRDIEQIMLPLPTVHFLAGSKTSSLISGLWQRARNSWLAYRALLKIKPDIVLCAQPDSWWVAVRAKRILHNKVVVNLLEIYEDRAMAFPRLLQPLVRKCVRSVLRNLTRSTDEIIHVSKARQDFYKFLGKPGTVISFFPKLSELATIDMPHSKTEIRIVHAGGLTWTYGSEQLIDAIPLVIKECPTAHFIVIGQTRSSLRNAALLDNLVKNGTVEITQNMSHADAMQLMQGCDIGLSLVLPLGNTYTLAMPRKLFEYLAVGIPVIGANMPTIREVIEGNQCGIVVDPEFPASIAEGILQLAVDTDLRVQMGRNGRRACETQFNGENESLKIRSLFERMEQ
jgi:glycosyltransferase involved in cell wall biosynthesis